MTKVFMTVAVLLIHTAWGSQIDVKNCIEVKDGNPQLSSQSSGNRVQLSVIKPNNFDLNAAKTSSQQFSLSSFLDQDLIQDEKGFGLYQNLSMFKNCKVWVKEGFEEVNNLGETCKQYHLFYYQFEDTEARNITDNILANKSSQLALTNQLLGI